MIAGVLGLLALLVCGFKSFNKFTPADLPLLVRSYSNFKNDRDGLFAERQIYRLSQTPYGLSELIKLTDSADGRVKSGSEEILWDITRDYYFPDNHQAAIELLNDLIEHETPSVRKFAYITLFRIASRSRHDDPENSNLIRASLVEGLRDPAFEVSEQVIRNLTTRYDDDWQYPTDAVMEIYNENSDPETHLNAAVALATMDPDFHDPIPVLIDNLNDSDYARQQQILSAIRNYEEAAVDVLPIIIKLIETNAIITEDLSSYNVAHSAAMTLHWTGAGDGSIITSLTELMYHERHSVRQVAVNALGNLESDGIPALPALKEKLDDPDEEDEWIPMEVANAITKIYRYAQRDKIVLDEIDYLLQLLESDRMEHQILAVEGLEIFAEYPRAEEALETLRVLSEGPYDEMDPVPNFARTAVIQIEYHVGIREQRPYSIMYNSMNGN